MTRLWRPGWCLRRGVDAGELEQRCRTGRVVVCPLSLAGVVAVREDHDRVGGASLANGEHVLELDSAATGDFRVKTVGFRLQPVLGEPFRHPSRCLRCGFRPRRPVGKLVREVLCGLSSRCAVEIRRQRRLGQGLRPRDRKGGDEQGNPDEKPGSAVHAAVDRSVNRAGARPVPLTGGRLGGHAWL